LSGQGVPADASRPTVAQVEENAGALRFGPLFAEQMNEISGLLEPTTTATG
jgi:hypothetical protein